MEEKNINTRSANDNNRKTRRPRSLNVTITNCVLDKPFKVIVTDKSVFDICIKLSVTNTEIKKIGVNYNQVVQALKHAFTEKLALSYLYRLEKRTIELIKQLQKVIELTEEYKQRWLIK